MTTEENNQNADVAEPVVEGETTTEETIAVPKSEWEKTNQTLGSLKRENKDLKKAKESTTETTEKNQPTSGLDETQLELLDFKGISEADDIKVIESVMKRTGQKLREVLKDDYVMGKLETNKKAREVANATPSGKKGTGSGSSDSVDYWVQKNAATGEWPKDYSLKQKVLAAKERAAGTNVPSWQQ